MSYLRAHLRAKLMLLVSLPLLAGGALTFWLMLQQSADVDRYGALRQVARLGATTGAALHALEAERGARALALLPKGPATEDGDAKRRATDEALVALEPELRQTAGALEAPAQDALRSLQGLKSLRAGGPEGFTPLVRSLLSLEAVLHEPASGSPLEARFHALASLAEAQEAAAQEREAVALALATRSETSARLLAEGATGQAQEARYLTQAPGPLRTAFRAALGAGEAAEWDRLRRAARSGAAEPLSPRWFDAATAHRDALRGLEARHVAELQAETERLEAAARRLRLMLLAGALAFGATVLAFTHGTAERILRPIHALEEGMLRMRVGDLSARLVVHGADETARMTQAFNAMGAQLSELVQHLKGAARKVADGAGGVSAHAGQMSGAAQELAKNVLSQRKAAEHSAAAVYQLSASVEQVRASLDVARAEGRRAQDLAEAGHAVGQEVRHSMEEASQRAQRLAKGALGLKDLLHQALGLVKQGRAPEPARLEEALDRCAQAAGNAANLAAQNAQAMASGQSLVAGMVDALEGIHGALKITGRQAEEIGRTADDQSAAGREVAGRMAESSRSIGAVQLAAAQLANTSPELALTAKELVDIARTLERSSEAFTLA